MQTIRVDGCSICQLKCVQCPVTQMGYTNTIGNGYLHKEDFYYLFKVYPKAKHIEFDNFGELFLNKDLSDIMIYAYNHNIMLSCPVGVNLNNVQESVLETMVKTKFNYLSVSIDGSSQETYEKYRVGGKFNEVIKNIKLINKYKQKYNTIYPKLQWQFIVFGHNEHEIPSAKQLATELGMQFYPKMNWNDDYSPIKNIDFVKQETKWEITTRKDYQQKYGANYAKAACYSLWNDPPRLSWDLTTTGCCWNIWSRFDHYNLNYAKLMLLGKIPIRANHPCIECNIYQDMIKTNQFLNIKEICKNKILDYILTFIKYGKWRANL